MPLSVAHGAAEPSGLNADRLLVGRQNVCQLHCADSPARIRLLNRNSHFSSTAHSMDESRVTFLARNPNKSSPQGQIPISLTGIEFTRRWSLHILPKHFTKTRYFGGYSSNQRTEFIETCRRFVPKNRDVQPDDLADATSESDSRRSNSDESDSSERELRDEDASPKCPSCGEPMDLVLRSHRPAWREVFYGPDHPAWFES